METLPLKDIHLPDAVSGWPPAPGWWLLMLLMPLTLWLSWRLYRHLTQQTASKYARPLLLALKHDSQLDGLTKLTQLSELMRRVAISLAPRREVAGLSGEAWLHYLDATLNAKKLPKKLAAHPFSLGVGRYLAHSHFQRRLPDEVEWDELFSLCEYWLTQQHNR